MKSILLLSLVIVGIACTSKNEVPSEVLIKGLDLKRGDVISCGPADKEFGSLAFDISGNEAVKKDFTLALKLLHSFEYDEAEKVFAKIIDQQPACAMAYWGVAMSNFHPLWAPPTEAELKKGASALEIAKGLEQSKKEAAYIEAVGAFYNSWQTLDHHTRCINFEKAMEKLYTNNRDDKEAAILYSLSLTAAADPSDKSFVKQKKAGAILNGLYPSQPNHPGIVHYLIHTYDSPELAELGLPAAKKYASVAPSSAHALHMPSHIFTRLGLWGDCITSNLASANSAQCYAKSMGIKGHWDEELHALDYLMYAYLQRGENDKAKQQLDYLATINEVHPANFKVAYAFASIPARYVLENKSWREAASLKIPEKNFSWETFPWEKAILHFTRALGSLHTDNLSAAKTELVELKRLHTILIDKKDAYKAGQVEIQLKAAQAWLTFKEGNNKEALRLMTDAADMEDKTEKHPVTPGEVIPARELLGDLFFAMGNYTKALEAYEMSLKKHHNRFNGLYSAGLSAEKQGDTDKANYYFKQLNSNAAANSNRPELIKIKSL